MNILDKEKKLEALEKELSHLDDEDAIQDIRIKIEDYKRRAMKNLTAWDRVLLARHKKRPTAQDVIDNVFDDFIELHGDRKYGDDKAIVGGIGKIGGHVVTVIGEQKGKTTEENIECNFAMPHPEGYRKALRLMRQAQKFNRPIVTLIDTPGAFPGIGAEARGQSEAIAKNLQEMSQFGVPILAVVIGEGGSGGALAIGMGNQVFMLENSIYSILSPEGYASILWKDSSLAQEAAEAMKLTSYDLKELDIIDAIIPEPVGGAHREPEKVYRAIQSTLIQALAYYSQQSPYEIKTGRYAKYRNLGFFQRFNYENLKGVVK